MTYTHVYLGPSIGLEDMTHLNSGAIVEYQLQTHNTECGGSISK